MINSQTKLCLTLQSAAIAFSLALVSGLRVPLNAAGASSEVDISQIREIKIPNDNTNKQLPDELTLNNRVDEPVRDWSQSAIPSNRSNSFVIAQADCSTSLACESSINAIDTITQDLAQQVADLKVAVSTLTTRFNALSGDLDNIKNNVTTNTADIKTNSTNIATNTADIKTNSTNIATNSTNIATNTADIATNSTNIATNTADIATNSARIDAINSTNTSTDSARIDANTADIANNTARISTAEDNITRNAIAIQENKALIGQAFNEIEENSSGVAMALALSSITKGLPPGKRYGVGIAVGSFKNQQSLAASGTFSFTDPNSSGIQVISNISLGLGINKSTFGSSAGISIHW